MLFPAISPNVHIISFALATQLSLSPHRFLFFSSPLSCTFSAALQLHKVVIKKKRNNKIFSCVLGFVLQSYLTKHEISFSRPKSLPTPLPTSGLFILLWFWEVVSESLMICCVCSFYPSTHYSSTHLLPTDLNAKGVIKIHFFPFHMN